MTRYVVHNIMGHFSRVPGEKMFVDWAGDKLPIHDPATGASHPASLFVSVLGYSSYTWAEVAADEQMEAWLGAHLRAWSSTAARPRL